MISKQRKLANLIIEKMFAEQRESILIAEEVHKICQSLENTPEHELLTSEVLESLNCQSIDFYDEMTKKPKGFIQLIESYIIDIRDKFLIPRYYLYQNKKLIRSDHKQDTPESKEIQLRLLFNQEVIQKYILANDEYYFEKLSALFLRYYYGCEKVGVLRNSGGPDGGLDCFGIMSSKNSWDENKVKFIFGQSKNSKKVDTTDVEKFIKDHEEKFNAMIKGLPQDNKYVLRRGTDIQNKLLEEFPQLYSYDIMPVLICSGLITESAIKKIDSKPYAIQIHFSVSSFIKPLFEKVGASDYENFNRWFEPNFPHAFIPDAFGAWLAEEFNQLVIIGRKE
jgi:hypothetical protein